MKETLLLVVAIGLSLPALFAQTCTDFSSLLGPAINTEFQGEVFNNGDMSEVCGNVTANGEIQFDDQGVGSVVNVYRDNGDGTFTLVGSPANGTTSPVAITPGNYSITVTFGSSENGNQFNMAVVGMTPAEGSGNANGIILADPAFPVTLASFTGRAAGKMVKLDWITSSESENEGFEVQRSANGISWGAIDFVAASSNGSGGAAYAFHDESPLPGQAYYRLKQMDFGGAFHISPVVTVENTNVDAMSVFPNPAGASINVRIPVGDGAVPVHVVDQSGRCVLTRQLTGNDVLDLSGLSAGVYSIHAATATGKLSQRFVKQ